MDFGRAGNQRVAHQGGRDQRARGGGDLTATVGNLGVIKSQPMKDEAGRPTSIQNAMLAEGFQLGYIQVAPSGHRWSDPDMPRAFDTTSGALANFDWSGS